jgi:hypothetical protein
MSFRRLMNFSVPFLCGTALLGTYSCKSNTNQGQVKDVILSPDDPNEGNGIIWQTSDGNVHYALCPSLPVSQTCAGIKETVTPVPIATYKDKLTAAVLNGRKMLVNSANGTYSEINLVRTKMKRLNEKIKTGGLTPGELAAFNTQLTGYDADLQKLLVLSADEQKKVDFIVNSLQASTPITIDEGEESFILSIVPFGLGLGRVSTLPLTPPGTVGNKIEIEKLLAAWNDEAEMFYGTNTIYTPATKANAVGILQESLSTCLQACPPYYSDLSCHFYCWLPSYKQVVPNVRGCFTSIARDQLVKKPNGQPLNLYPEVFDYCMYQEYDQVLKSIPQYDENVIAQRKSTNRATDRVGVLKYMSPKQEDAFKYVMFNWYNPFAFDLADQQAILDKFYAAHPNQTVPHVATATGKANHPRFAPILAYMQNQYASGGLGTLPKPASGPATSCAGAGKLVDGFCWYLAPVGESCDSTCSAAGLTSSSGTINFSGSAGDDASCGKVASAFNESLTAPSSATCPAVGCAKCDASCQAPLASTVFRCSGTATSTATKAPGVQPFCSCQ